MVWGGSGGVQKGSVSERVLKVFDVSFNKHTKSTHMGTNVFAVRPCSTVPWATKAFSALSWFPLIETDTVGVNRRIGILELESSFSHRG